MVLKTVVDQHAEEASFFWLLRDAAVRAPYFVVDDLAKLDTRLEAHLDGLRIAGDYGRNVFAAASAPDPGRIFSAAVLALETRDDSRLDQLLTEAENPALVRGLISALGWVSKDHLRGTVKDLLSSPVPRRRHLGVAACAVHRVDPGPALQAAVVDEDEPLRARGLRAIGELGRTDLLGALQAALRSNGVCRFWAAWSLVMTGNRGAALDVLRAFGASETPFRLRAMHVLLRVLSPTDARQWLKDLHSSESALRDVVVGAGMTGDSSYVPWLIGHMTTPNLARLAGESLNLITGADLANKDLQGVRPEGFESGPTDNPDDEDVTMDPDEGLPWPEPDRIREWWNANQNRFTPGNRYFLGKPVTAEHCWHVLQTGHQRQRIAAALELALMEPDAPLFESRSPGFRQKEQLANRLSQNP